jgi:hypothetical protein
MDDIIYWNTRLRSTARAYFYSGVIMGMPVGMALLIFVQWL